MASATAILLIALSTTPGCYERTISAHGLGADQYDVSEPYQENSQLDNWIFGPQEDSKSSKSLLHRH
jgi:hypothetical protein